jgi:hypothetical protein
VVRGAGGQCCSTSAKRNPRPNFRLPLSGDVTQAINPWTWFFRTVGSQFGLININLGKSSDPVLEEQILNDVGSYGRQIGQIGDALRVLLDHVKLDGLKPQEERALKALRYQLDEVDRLKSKRLDQVRAVGTA